MKIGERIRNSRQSSNLTQEELAERANLTKGFISQIERDLTSISLDSLAQILEALDENISDFFREGSEEKIIYREKDRVAIDKEKIEKFELLVPGSTNRRPWNGRFTPSAASAARRWCSILPIRRPWSGRLRRWTARC